MNIRSDEFDETELTEAKKLIKEGKSCGDDGVAPEIIKRVDIDIPVLEFCNQALSHGDIPDHWKRLNLILIPKKRNHMKTEN